MLLYLRKNFLSKVLNIKVKTEEVSIFDDCHTFMICKYVEDARQSSLYLCIAIELAHEYVIQNVICPMYLIAALPVGVN